MGGFFKSIVLAGVAITMLAPGIASADEGEDPFVLTPSSKWHVNYADDSCRLVRSFGEEEDALVFFAERYEPGDSFFMVVAGNPLDAGRFADTVFRFGPDGYEYDGPSQTGDLGEYSPAVMVSQMLLIAHPDIVEEAEKYDDFDLEKWTQEADVFGQTISAEQEAAISWLEIRRGQERPIRLELGSMGPPMAALRKCTEELLTHWGIDLETHRGLTRGVEPKSDPGRWLRPRDYPSELVRKGTQGLVQFRLSVGADGKPTQCHIQRSTRPEAFDKAVCNTLMRRAEFEPALDAKGQPVASFWRSTVRFMIPE